LEIEDSEDEPDLLIENPQIVQEPKLENNIQLKTFCSRPSIIERKYVTLEDFDWRTYINNYSLEFRKLN